MRFVHRRAIAAAWRRPRTYPVFAQFIRYATAGAVGTGVHYSLLLVLVEVARIGAVPASTCGAIAGAFVNYALNYRFTFRSTRPHAEALVKYFTVTAIGIAMNALVVAAATHQGLHYMVAQVLATGIVLLVAFIANRTWTF
jgi:putative flippase GtrA